MTEEVLFNMEKEMSNSEIAKHLRNIADKLEKGEPINLESGVETTELATNRPAEFEIKAERENGEESLELEIEWSTAENEEFKIN